MVDRIKKIIDQKKMSPTQFADAIEVQRSSLSHVLSGRNKPSLDFMLKIKNSFPEINLDWLLLGQGSMIIQTDKMNPDLTEQEIPELDFTKNKTGRMEETVEKKIPEKSNNRLNPENKDSGGRKPNKVIIFYNDNTFELFDISK